MESFDSDAVLKFSWKAPTSNSGKSEKYKFSK